MVVDRNNRVCFFWLYYGEKYRYLDNGFLSDIIPVYPSWPDTSCGLQDFAIDQDNAIQSVGVGGLGSVGYGAWFTFNNDQWGPFVPLCNNTFYESAISLNSIGDPSFVWRQLLPSNHYIEATYFSEIKNNTPTEPVLLGERTSYADIALDYTDKHHIVESQESDSTYQLVHRYRTGSGWQNQIVEENKTWYIYNNLLS
jgi:hypothetical protein